MSIKPDHWIKQMVKQHNMIDPFEEKMVKNGNVSFGLSSYGYDLRCAPEFKIFTNVHSAVVDPKKFNENSFVDIKGKECVIPPNSFVLTRSIEYFKIPKDVLGLCIGKCVTGDTRLIEPGSGKRFSMNECISKEKKRLANWNCKSAKEDHITDYLLQGLKPVYKLNTRSGRQIEATANHPFKTFYDWRMLSDLSVGDRIAVPRSIPFFGKGTLTFAESTILGLMLSDGQCKTPGSSPRYTSDDQVLHQAIEYSASQLGLYTKPVGKMSRNITSSPSRGGIMVQNRMSKWLRSLGLDVTSKYKFIPDCVFEAPKEVVARFLASLFSGDGTVYRSGNLLCVGYYSISERLARDVHHLLLRFGIISFFSQKTNKRNGYISYNVTITSKNDICTFAERIGFIIGSRKWKKLQEIVKLIRQYPKQKSNHDTIPSEAWKLLQESCRTHNVSMNSLGFKPHWKQSVPRELMIEVSNTLSDKNLMDRVENDIYWDTVKSIEFCGIKPVYDITMQQDHNFIANDFIVHNSTYARCGIIVNVTPLQPEWEGCLIVEISNTTPLPAKIYAHEGIAEILFFQASEVCDKSYKDLSGMYSHQKSIVLPKVRK